MSVAPVKAWVCSICGYVHYGDEPPAECPMCGAVAEFFEPSMEEVQPLLEPAGLPEKRQVVIVGAGIAGVSAAEAVRKADPSAQIRLFYNEPGLPYYRMNLTRYLAGEITASELPLHPQEWYFQQRIELCAGLEVTGINLFEKFVLAGGERVPYDTLILASGARPFTPPIPGTEIKNVTTLRTQANAALILEAILPPAAAGERPLVVCIGGGILGLETAGALACRGARVTVLESQDWLLPRQLNAPAARIFQAFLAGLGIEVVTRARIREITASGEGPGRRVSGVALEGAAGPIPASLVVISAGVRSNIHLARDAGLAVKNGVVVDEFMRTSHPDVLAAGDLAEVRGVSYGLWAPAQAQGAAAGGAAAGRAVGFKEVPPSATLKVLGIDLFSAGAVNDPAAQLVDREAARGYTGFLFKDGIMSGAILLGDARPAARVRKAMEDHVDFSGVLADDAGVEGILKALG